MRGVNTGYALAYRFGFTPWERYGTAAVAAARSHVSSRGEGGRPWGSTTSPGPSMPRATAASLEPLSWWETWRALSALTWACPTSSLTSAASSTWTPSSAAPWGGVSPRSPTPGHAPDARVRRHPNAFRRGWRDEIGGRDFVAGPRT